MRLDRDAAGLSDDAVFVAGLRGAAFLADVVLPDVVLVAAGFVATLRAVAFFGVARDAGFFAVGLGFAVCAAVPDAFVVFAVAGDAGATDAGAADDVVSGATSDAGAACAGSGVFLRWVLGASSFINSMSARRNLAISASMSSCGTSQADST